MSPHVKCRHPNSYPGEKVERFQVPENMVSWTIEFPDYKPIEFTAKKVLGKPVWADPDIRFVCIYYRIDFLFCFLYIIVGLSPMCIVCSYV